MSVSLIDGHIDPDTSKMTPQDAIEWLKAIEAKYVHGGDEAFDNKRKTAINTAIEALEKQIPKKVKMTNELYPMGICPCCENEFIPHTGFEHCHYCGQALDWSDTE